MEGKQISTEAKPSPRLLRFTLQQNERGQDQLQDLLQQAVVESDSKKLSALVQKILEALDKKAYPKRNEDAK